MMATNSQPHPDAPAVAPARTPRIFSYVVASDNGLAPNVDGDNCTLAVCKPKIRAYAQPGDWIVGMSTAADGRKKMIYAMQVEEKISYDAFFRDPRFEAKKPIHAAKGDNFFVEENGTYRVAFRSAAHAGRPAKIATDLSVPQVVVGQRFWYFGANAPTLPEPLWETPIALPDATRRGHRVSTDSAQLAQLTDWLGPIPPGIHGRPRDAATRRVHPAPEHSSILQQ